MREKESNVYNNNEKLTPTSHCRFRKNSTQEFKALDKASPDTQRLPSYYTVESHAIGDGRISSLSDTNNSLNNTAATGSTAAALKQNLNPNDVITDIEMDRLNVPKISYYDRISMSDIQSDPNVGNKPTASGVAEQGKMENDRQSVQVVNMAKDRERKGGVSPAAYDKLTFTLPPACKLPHYHTANPVRGPDDGKYPTGPKTDGGIEKSVGPDQTAT